MGDFSPKFFGPFYLINQIGKGGTADVFLGIIGSNFDEKQPKKSMYAIKRLLPKLSKEKSFVQCLTSEAKVASILQHSNIVSVSDLGNVGTDYYLSMEWINGKSLFDVLKTVKNKKKAISSHYLLYICYEIAKGLDFAHKAKDTSGRPLDIVHCDISPHNILISYSGKVKLSDFGIATAAKQKEQIVGDTVFGKIHYIAPEQISHKGFDYRADIYSFGVLLYESLTFQKPFRAKSQIELQNKIRNEPPSLDHPVLQKDQKIRTFLKSCLAKNPEDRPKDLAEFQKIYEKTYANKQVDQKKIGRLMQHLFRDTIVLEKGLFKQRIQQFKHDLRKKEKDDLERLERERSQDVVDRTEILSNDPGEEKTKILRKDESKEGLGKVNLEKKKIVRVIPKVPIVEEVSRPPHDPVFPDNEAIDGEVDDSIFDVEGDTFSKNNLEANIDLDAIKKDAADEQSEVTYVSNVKDKEADDLDGEDPNEMDSAELPSLPIETKKITTDTFNMFKTEPGTQTDTNDVASEQDYLVDRPDADVESVESTHSDNETVEKNIMESPYSSEVFYQREDQAPVPPDSFPSKKAAEFSNSMQPLSSFQQDEDTINIQIPKSWLRFGLPLICVVAALFFGFQFLQSNNMLSSSSEIHNVQVFISYENDKVPLFKTENEELTQIWMQNTFFTPLQKYFEQQHALYSDQKLDLNIETLQIQKSPSFEWEGSFLKPTIAFEHLRNIFQLPKAHINADDGRLYVHLFYMNDERRLYPFQYSGKSPSNAHLAFLPMNQSIKETRVILAHQILRLLGADVLTNDKGHPLFPDGYAEPSKQPLHPQPMGEIMTLMIPQSPTESYLLDDLQFAKIGKTTAKQIGWVKRK